MSHQPPMNGRQPTMLDLLRVAGERDGVKARAEQLAAQVRTTTVSLGGRVDAAKAEAERLRGLLRESFEALANGITTMDLQQRLAAELGVEWPTSAGSQDVLSAESELCSAAVAYERSPTEIAADETRRKLLRAATLYVAAVQEHERPMLTRTLEEMKVTSILPPGSQAQVEAQLRQVLTDAESDGVLVAGTVAKLTELHVEVQSVASLLEVLRGVEWSADDDGANCCPSCREWQSHGEHEANCKLAKAIGAKRKARIKP